MTDIDWPSLRVRDRQHLLELMPALRGPALTQGEVLALGDGWDSAVRNPQYWPARNEAFSAEDTGYRWSVMADEWQHRFTEAEWDARQAQTARELFEILSDLRDASPMIRMLEAVDPAARRAWKNASRLDATDAASGARWPE